MTVSPTGISALLALHSCFSVPLAVRAARSDNAHMKPQAYLETTILSYLSARPSRDLIVAGHQQITREWWDRRRNEFSLFISQFVADEAGQGDPEAVRRRMGMVAGLRMLEITHEVGDLAAAVLRAGVIPRESATDAAHIAVAALHGMDFLLTWNCAHIANAKIITRLRALCEARGLRCPVICTPEELLGE